MPYDMLEVSIVPSHSAKGDAMPQKQDQNKTDKPITPKYPLSLTQPNPATCEGYFWACAQCPGCLHLLREQRHQSPIEADFSN